MEENQAAKAARHSPQGDGGLSSDSVFHYVYTLESVSKPGEIDTGQTRDLRRRLAEHNAGKVPHTSKFVPWGIRCARAAGLTVASTGYP